MQQLETQYPELITADSLLSASVRNQRLNFPQYDTNPLYSLENAFNIEEQAAALAATGDIRCPES